MLLRQARKARPRTHRRFALIDGDTMKSLAFKAAFVGLAFACAGMSPAVAQTKPYPHKIVTLVTHSSPGGGSDVFLRELVKYLGPAMNVNFAVENVTGGSGAKAMAFVAKGKPDGSIFYATTPTYIQTTLMSKAEVGYTALEPVAIVFEDPDVLYTRVEAPYKNLKDLIDQARSNPGKSRWGASNPGSLERITLERMSRKVGVKAVVVPHEGGGDMMINVLNGTLDIGMGEVEELQGQLQAGKIRILAALSDKRLQMLPNVPTAKEQGVDIVVHKFRGLAGPKGISPEAADALDAGLQKVLADPAFKKSYTESNLIPHFLPHKEAVAFTNQFAAEVTQTLKELGVVK
jgi:putative tricarboxylic transport membrane protein